MSDLMVVGGVALSGGSTATLTARYPAGWRDSLGRISAGSYVGFRTGAGAWEAPGGGAYLLPGAAASGDPLPLVDFLLVVQVPGLPPSVQSFQRFVRATSGSTFDFTLPDGDVVTWEGPPAGGGAGPSVPGSPGTKGDAGNRVLTGLGEPSPVVGLTHDLYLDKTTSDLYERGPGGWTLIVSLRGRPGTNGLDGLPGSRGLQGSIKPLPVLPEQEGYIPVASELAGGDGWSWKPVKFAGLRMRDLADVSLNSLQDGQTLIWNTASSRFVPGDVESGGGGDAVPAVQTRPVIFNTPNEQLGFLYGTVALNQLQLVRSDTPLLHEQDFVILPVLYKFTLPNNFTNGVTILSSAPYRLYDSTGLALGQVNNNLYGGVGGVHAFQIPPGDYYLRLDRAVAATDSFVVFYTGGYTFNTLGWQYEPNPADTSVYSYFSVDPASWVKFQGPVEAGGQMRAIARTSGSLTLKLLHAADFSQMDGVEVASLDVTPDNQDRVYTFPPVAESGAYILTGIGDGYLTFVDTLAPGEGLPDPYHGATRLTRVSELADIARGDLGVLFTAGQSPKLVYRSASDETLELSAGSGSGVKLLGTKVSTTDLPGGATLGDAYIVDADGHVYVWDSSIWADAGPLRGPQGVAGAVGPAGIPGADGLQGIQGPIGPAGPAGSGGSTSTGTRVAYTKYRLNITTTTGTSNPEVAELNLRDATTQTRLTGGTASGANYGGYVAANAFDGDVGTFWVSSTTSTGMLVYTLPTAKAVDQYSIMVSQQYGSVEAPIAWTLEGSNDSGATWTVLHTIAASGAWENGETKTYPIPLPTAARNTLDPVDFPAVAAVADIPNSGAARLIGSTPAKIYVRSSSGQLFEFVGTAVSG